MSAARTRGARSVRGPTAAASLRHRMRSRNARIGAVGAAAKRAVRSRRRARSTAARGATSAGLARRTTDSTASLAHCTSGIGPTRSAARTMDASSAASHASDSSSRQSPLKTRLTRTYAASALTQCHRRTSGASLPPLSASKGSKSSSSFARGGKSSSALAFVDVDSASSRTSATAGAPLALARGRPASGDSHHASHGFTSSPLAIARSKLARSSSFNSSGSSSPPRRRTSKLFSLSTHRSPSPSPSPSSSSSSSSPSPSLADARSNVPSANACRFKLSIIAVRVSDVAVNPRIARASSFS